MSVQAKGDESGGGGAANRDARGDEADPGPEEGRAGARGPRGRGAGSPGSGPHGSGSRGAGAGAAGRADEPRAAAGRGDRAGHGAASGCGVTGHATRSATGGIGAGTGRAGAEGALPQREPTDEELRQETSDVLAAVGPRLRRIRKERGTTLAGLSAVTGISVSTLSRLESGLRRPSLELLLPLARAHRVPLDELVGAPAVEDPRVRTRPIVRFGRTHYPLTRQPGGLQAYKVVEPVRDVEPEPRTHEGYEWLYVLSGRLRLVLADYDVVLGAGEAAEFDTRLPHWFGSTGEGPVEFLSLFGPQGERMHVRARPARETKAD